MRLTKQEANIVKCPLIKESPVSIECKVKEIVKLGSHDMFIAEIVSIDADEKYIDKTGAFDITKCNLIAYSNGKYFVLGKKVGKFGYSVQKKKIVPKQKRNTKNATNKKIEESQNNKIKQKSKVATKVEASLKNKDNIRNRKNKKTKTN